MSVGTSMLTPIEDNDQQQDARARLYARRSEIREIAIHDIAVDTRFQRGVNRTSLARIIREFHPAGLGQVLVNHVALDGAERPPYDCVDGQTRVLAELTLLQQQADGISVPPGLSETIRAEVFVGLDAAECAVLFELRNAQVTVPTAEKRRIKMTAGDPLTIETVLALQDAGYVPYPSLVDQEASTARLDYRVTEEACRINDKGQKKGYPSLLAEVLAIQNQAYVPEGESPTYDLPVPEIMHALADILVRNREHAMPGELVIALRPKERLLAEADSLIASGIGAHPAFRARIVSRYSQRNRGKRGLK